MQEPRGAPRRFVFLTMSVLSVRRNRQQQRRELSRHHREGRLTDEGEVILPTCGAGDLIQLKTRSTAAARPTANIVRG
jgi:hypothetical protein